jgi:ribosomal protein S18
MFASFRLRLFSSAASGNGAAGGAGNYTIQQAGRDLARTVRQKAHLPFRPNNNQEQQTPVFYEFGLDFCKQFDARKLQKELLEAQVQSKLKKDKNSPDVIGSDTWNPSKYVQEIIDEAGYLSDETQDANKDAAQPPAEEPFWERNKRAAAIAALHKPVELIKTGREIHFMNGFFLSRFISDGGKMLPRFKSGLNAKQQRKVAREVRKARQLGIIPIMQKFLPSFEANLPGQALPNPLAGVWKPLPFRKKGEIVKEDDRLSREQIAQLVRDVEEEIEAEKEFQPEIKLGLPEIDELKTEKDLLQYLQDGKKNIPEIYSVNRLRFRATEIALSKMSTGELRTFLERNGADMSDCSKDEHISLRVRQYLQAFEEHVFRDSKVYNSIRFSKEKMRLFGKPVAPQFPPFPFPPTRSGGTPPRVDA